MPRATSPAAPIAPACGVSSVSVRSATAAIFRHTCAYRFAIGFAVRERIQANRIAHEARAAEQVSEFLVRLFQVSNPSEARGDAITAREILDKGAARIDPRDSRYACAR